MILSSIIYVFFSVICYGLYLTFCSTLCPSSCLPSFLPLASLASSLGTSYPLPMAILGAAAAILHLGEAAYTFHLTHFRYKFRPLTTALWTGNVLLGGIFGLWVLIFPRAFWTVAQVYCKIPASFCYNL